jgi:O-antigen/teichoic acid export membrane protein
MGPRATPEHSNSVSSVTSGLPARDVGHDDAHIAAGRPRSIAQGGVDAVLSRVLVLVCLVALVIVTGRLMEPAGRGLYALATVAASLCGLPLGAVWIANAVEVARRRAPLSEIFGGSTVIAFFGGLAIALVAIAVSPLFGDRWWLVALPAAVTPFMLLSRYQEGLYTSIGHVRAVNLIRIARAALPLLFITPPLLAGASARTAIAIWVLWWVALPVILFFPARSVFGRPRLPRERGFYRRVVTYGTKISGLNTVTMLNDRVGLLALAAFASDADVGIYSIALAGTQALLLVTEALTLSAFQRIGSSSRRESAALTARAIRHGTLLAAAGGILLVPITLIAVPLTLGPEYADVPMLLALLIPTAIASAAFLPLYAFFEVQITTPAMRLKVAGSALLASVIMCTALAPVWGRWGVAVGTSIAYLLAAAVAYWCFKAESGTGLRELRPGRAELRDYLALAQTYRARWSRAS